MFRLLLLWLLAGALIVPAASAAVDGFGAEVLPPQDAFVLNVTTPDANTVRASWDIVDGYYLYRKNFRFETDSAGISLGEASFPDGKIKEDEFFGRVEIYRDQVAVNIPVTRLNDARDFSLIVVSQGCADIGICYPPQKQTVAVSLPILTSPAASVSSGPSGPSVLDRIGSALGLKKTFEPLPPDQAFTFNAEPAGGNRVRIHWTIADGYYLYRDKFGFDLQNADGIQLGAIAMPAGKHKVDEAFGEQIVYYHAVALDLPLQRTQLAATDIDLVVKYQGCADFGFCYPPMTRSVALSLPAGDLSPIEDGNTFVAEQDRIAQSLIGGNLAWIVLAFFGFGLLLAFTPCVFPMIPILSSIIVGQGESLGTRRAFALSLVYVLAMALTYTTAGIIAGLSGANLQAAFQNPWLLGAFSAVFVLLALSMFGFYELQMPNVIQSRLTAISNKQGRTVLGVGVMGFLSALIVGPCVAAPLIGALIYISQTGDWALGGIALFALSIGMGAPLLVIGTSAGKFMPRAGDWMNNIKAVFGVLLLALAIWMLERILPTVATMILWAALLITSGIYLGALEPFGRDATGWRKLWKGVGLISLAYGVLMLIGVAAGGRDVLQPLNGVVFSNAADATNTVGNAELHFERIKSLDDLQQAITAAQARNRPVMLDFYADWCVSCKEMERYTFSDPAVQQALSGFVILQADVTANDAIDQTLMQHFGIFGPPSILFFDASGTELRPLRLVGFMNAEKFYRHVQRVTG